MSDLLCRYHQLSEAQRARFVGYLLGGVLPAAMLVAVESSFVYAEGCPRGGDADRERPHQAIGRIARERAQDLTETELAFEVGYQGDV